MTAIIHVDEIHTPDQVADELRHLLGAAPVTLTCGGVIRLRLAESPFVHGGSYGEDDVQAAMAGIGAKSSGDWQRDALAIQAAIAAANRAFEIVPPDPRYNPNPPPPLGPEWLADLAAAAGAALPGLTWDYFLWQLPFVAAAHLLAAAVRKNGGHTRRPDNVLAALKALQALRPGQADGLTVNKSK